MKRIKNLDFYQKGILILIFIMLFVFTVLYFITTSREGFAYKDAILVPKQENETTIYSGKIKGKSADFIVSDDKIVTFQYGDKVYGPYTIKEDSTAIPKDSDTRYGIRGIELYYKEEMIFRGGVLPYNDSFRLYNEDGSHAGLTIYAETSNGDIIDANGNVIDPMEPSISTIIDLMTGPKLTHKGTWIGWFCGVFLCLCTTISILFADELFRLGLAFEIRNINQAEPSDWNIAGRYIGWTILSIMILVIFIRGLQYLN